MFGSPIFSKNATDGLAAGRVPAQCRSTFGAIRRATVREVGGNSNQAADVKGICHILRPW